MKFHTTANESESSAVSVAVLLPTVCFRLDNKKPVELSIKMPQV